MPLIKGKSSKAVEHNIKAEMHAGKPQDQALAIAYDVKRRSKRKKMAEGGEVLSAKSEKRPMPDNRYNDSKDISQNSGKKPPGEDSWTDQPTVRQAQKPSITPLSRPKIANGIFKVRDRDDVDKEEMMMSKLAPSSYDEQPDSEYDEMGAKRQGPKVPDMQDEHSTHRKPYAKGGQIEPSDEHIHMDGKYEDDLTDLPPSEDEGLSMAISDDEEGQDRQGPAVPDMEREHSNGRKPYASGGSVRSGSRDMDYADGGSIMDSIKSAFGSDDPQPKTFPSSQDIGPKLNTKPQKAFGGSIEDEDLAEHHASVAAAIMAKRDREQGMYSDSDDDRMSHMAEGGILSHDSIYSDDSDMADMSRNHDEDANEEDQLSYNALRKENYNDSNLDKDQPEDSNLKGDDREKDEEDKHDMITAIRSKMIKQRIKGLP